MFLNERRRFRLEEILVIVALAGRRVDAPDAEVSRFPLQNVPTVRERIRDLFEGRRASGLVCSAACGADLLALEVAGELGIHRRIILPFDKKRFRKTSVTDRPGDWGDLYDQICRAVATENGVLELEHVGDEDEAYKAVNVKILDDAISLSSQGAGERGVDSGDRAENSVLVVVVWEGASRGDGDLTADFADSGRRRGVEVDQVLTV